jgi:protein ECT2
VFHELVQTEANYTAILRTILDVFKKSLEDPNLIGGQLLNQTEIRIIFGNLPPIYEIHSKMLAEFYQVRINHHVVVSRADIFKENLHTSLFRFRSRMLFYSKENV